MKRPASANPNLSGINWRTKGQNIAKSLTAARKKLDDSINPLRQKRYFLVAKPEPTLFKESKSKRRSPDGTVEEKTNFAKQHSRFFGDFGLHLLHVNEDGSAVQFHAKPERLEQLVFATTAIDTAGRFEHKS